MSLPVKYISSLKAWESPSFWKNHIWYHISALVKYWFVITFPHWLVWSWNKSDLRHNHCNTLLSQVRLLHLKLGLKFTFYIDESFLISPAFLFALPVKFCVTEIIKLSSKRVKLCFTLKIGFDIKRPLHILLHFLQISLSFSFLLLNSALIHFNLTDSFFFESTVPCGIEICMTMYVVV